MKKNFIVALLFLNFIGVKAQSANLDREYFKVSHIVLPSNPILNDSDRTYNLRVLNTIDQQSRKDIVRNDINIQGFTKLPSGGVLDISIEINPVQIGEIDIKKTEIENKDKEGNVKSITRIYNVIIPYRTNGKMVIRNTLSGETKSYNYGKGETFESKDFKSHTSANEYYKNNYPNLKDGFNNTFFEAVVSNANNRLNGLYGYTIKSGQDHFWILDSRKHPETLKHKEMYELMKEAFASKMKSNAATDELASALAPAIAYFEGVPARYPGDKKRIRKLKYASYYNLAQIYYYLDQPEKVIEYSEKLIENNYDKSDGKSMIKYANSLRKDLDKNQVTSRHFEVVTEDRSNDASLQPEVVETPVVETIIIEKKDPEFYVPTGSIDEINKFLKHTIKVIRNFEEAKGNYYKEDKYIVDPATKKILGQRFIFPGDDKYRTIQFVWNGDAIVGIKSIERELLLRWKENLISEIKLKNWSNDPEKITYNASWLPKTITPITDDKHGFVELDYDGQDNLIKVTKYFPNAISSRWIHQIFNFTRKPDTVFIKELIYKQRRKNIPKNILREFTEFYTQSSDQTFTVLHGWNAQITYLYNDKDQIISKSTLQGDWTNIRDFAYLNSTLFKEEYVRSKEGVLQDKEIILHRDIEKPSPDSPEYKWRKGKYKFDQNSELVWESRNNKWREKVNGYWSGWQFFRM